jgi:hypothetical protein
MEHEWVITIAILLRSSSARTAAAHLMLTGQIHQSW